MDDGLDTSLIIDGIEYSGANNEDANDGFDVVRFAAHHDFVDDYYIDDFYVRKFIPTEPTHGAWAPLETALSIDSPADVTYEACTTGHSVDWSAASEQPHSYSTYLDEVFQENATWDGSEISVSIDGLDIGTYNLSIIISNTFGITEIDSVSLSVEDTTIPILNHPADVSYNESDTGNTIGWTMTDLYPGNYEISRDNELIVSGLWNSSGESVQITADGLTAGTYTFNLTAIDQSGNSAFDLVNVVVIPTPLLGLDNMILFLMIGGVAVVVIIGAIACKVRR
jgi:hypothetical protein